MTKKIIPLWDATHPKRKQAIDIMCTIAKTLGRPKMFDADWFRVEDEIVNIIARKPLNYVRRIK